MKNDSTTTFLNFVLAALVILGVFFAYLAVKQTSQARAITPTVMQVNSKMAMFQSLVNDVNNYNQKAKDPEIARMLQNLQSELSKVK